MRRLSSCVAAAWLALAACSSSPRPPASGAGGSGGDVTGATSETGGSGGGGSAGTGGSGGSAGTGGSGGSGGSGGGAGGSAGTGDLPDASPDSAGDDQPEPDGDGGATATTTDGGGNAPPPSPKVTTPSAACGSGKPAPMQGYHDIQVGAQKRRYIIRLPSTYDGKKPWPVIFAFHGAGAQNATKFDTDFGFRAANGEKAVLVFGEALPRPQGGLSWMIDTAANMAYIDALVAWLKDNVCIDESRLFATGQSSGGYFSQTLGCQRGEVFRAVAPSSGGIRDFVNCMGNPGVWMSHGKADTGTAMDVAAAKMYWLTTKKCSMTTKPVDPAPCVEYQGCVDDVPFVFCEHSGGHPWPSYATKGVWTFFSRF